MIPFLPALNAFLLIFNELPLAFRAFIVTSISLILISAAIKVFLSNS